MAKWGDVNAALNRLAREGVISGFRTNIGDRDRAGPVEVAVTAPTGREEREVRGAVLRALARLSIEARVTVEQGA